MAAGIAPFQIDQYAEFLAQLLLTNSQTGAPLDLTGYEAQMDLSLAFGRPPFYTMASGDANNSITFPNPTGAGTPPQPQIQLYIPASITANFTWCQGVYALMLLPPEGGQPVRVLQGTILNSLGIQAFQPQ